VAIDGDLADHAPVGMAGGIGRPFRLARSAAAINERAPREAASWIAAQARGGMTVERRAGIGPGGALQALGRMANARNRRANRRLTAAFNSRRTTGPAANQGFLLARPGLFAGADRRRQGPAGQRQPTDPRSPPARRCSRRMQREGLAVDGERSSGRRAGREGSQGIKPGLSSASSSGFGQRATTRGSGGRSAR